MNATHYTDEPDLIEQLHRDANRYALTIIAVFIFIIVRML